MKISNMLNSLETTMFDNGFTRMIETTENIEPGVNQFKISKLLFEPSIDYKLWKFTVVMKFESLEQFENIVEDGDWYQRVISSYQCTSFALDDKKLLFSFNCEVAC